LRAGGASFDKLRTEFSMTVRIIMIAVAYIVLVSEILHFVQNDKRDRGCIGLISRISGPQISLIGYGKTGLLVWMFSTDSLEHTIVSCNQQLLKQVPDDSEEVLQIAVSPST
jgi:hypothetical protein